MATEKKILSELEKLRKKVDDIDLQLLKLFNQRGTIAQAVAAVKKKEAGDKTPFFYCPEREASILMRLIKENCGPLSTEVIQRFFKEIMSACLSLQQPIRIAYLGPEGTFTQQAAVNHFGSSANIIPYISIDDVFHAVTADNASYGVIPVENSIVGFVKHTLDNFFLYSHKICGEIILRIHHNLLIQPGRNAKKIKKIYGHNQAFAQCCHWLDRNYPTASRVAVNSNGEAAQILYNTKETGVAAIASEMAAKLYHLESAFSRIEDQADNTTRFLVLGHQLIAPSEHDKTSIIAILPDEPGSLHRLLSPFYSHGVNLIRLESKAVRHASWRYAFFIEFDGHRENEKVQKVLTEIENYAIDFNFLGSYPKVVIP